MKLSLNALFLVSVVGLASTTRAIDIHTTNSASTLADAIFGDLAGGITVTGSSYTGAEKASGTYDNLGWSKFSNLSSGILMTTGRAKLAEGPNDLSYAGEDNGGPTGTYLNYDGKGTNADLNDVATLRISFHSEIEQKLSFDFSFGSEEYYEYVNSPFNDAFFSFLDDNPVSLSLDLNDHPITVNNQFFKVDNRVDASWGEYDYNGENFKAANGSEAGISEMQYDGFTPVLRTTFTVTPGDHTLSFVIGDAGDNIYDSGVFISRGLGSSDDDDGTHEDPTPEPASLLALGGSIVAYAKRRRGARG